MAKTYLIKNIEQSCIPLKSDLWEQAEAARIDCLNWPQWNYLPNTMVYILSGNEGLSIKFTTDEKPYIRHYNHNDPVYLDSCVELFLNASPKIDDRYLNFELNAAGSMLLGFGKDRFDRMRVRGIHANYFDIKTEISQYGWQAKLFIPFSFLRRFYVNTSDVFMGNMYKCGDETPRPHFVSWAPIKAEKPDFHRPEYFGSLKIV